MSRTVLLVWPAVGPVTLYAEVSESETCSGSESVPDAEQRAALRRLGAWRISSVPPSGWRFVRPDDIAPDWLVDVCEAEVVSDWLH